MRINVDDHSLFTLFYADDQILLAEDSDDLSYIVKNMKES